MTAAPGSPAKAGNVAAGAIWGRITVGSAPNQQQFRGGKLSGCTACQDRIPFVCTDGIMCPSVSQPKFAAAQARRTAKWESKTDIKKERMTACLTGEKNQTGKQLRLCTARRLQG